MWFYKVNESEAEKVLFEDRSPETFMVGSFAIRVFVNEVAHASTKHTQFITSNTRTPIASLKSQYCVVETHDCMWR